MQTIIIVGFGFMGGMHAQVYSKLSRAKLVAVVDSNESECEGEPKQLGLEVPVYADLDEALAKHRRMSSTSACRRRPTAEFVRRALRAGKDVFCEKPFAASAREALALATAAERAGRKMQVGQCVRFWPEYQAFFEFVRTGQGGAAPQPVDAAPVGPADLQHGRLAQQGRLSGGAALDLHIHDTDFVHHLLGRPEAVTSVGTKDATGWSHIFTTYHFTGTAVTAEGGWNYPSHWGFQMAFQAVFERGTVEYDSAATPTLVAILKRGAKRPLAFREPRAGRSASGVGNVSTLGGYFNELKYFVDCLSAGGRRNWRRRGRRPNRSARSWRRSGRPRPAAR